MTGTAGSRTGRVRVLIVDNEPALNEVLSVAVTEAGWRPYPALDGRSALSTARGCAPHAVVLDGMLPDLDGLQVLRRLRQENPKLPVLMLTARDALEHRLDGLEAGADDYVTSRSPWRRSCCGCADCCAGPRPGTAAPTTPSTCSATSS